MRHSVKASLSLLLVFCVVALIVTPCLADPALAMTFGEVFTAGASAYAAQYGFAYEYSNNGNSSSVTNPSSWNDVSVLQDDLYEEYYNQADPSKYDKLPLPSKWSDNYHSTEWYHLVNEDVEPYAKHSSGSFAPITEVNYGSDITEIYDDYFNWLLGTKLGITKNSNGIYVLPNASYSINVTSTTSIPNQPVPVYNGYSSDVGLYMDIYSNFYVTSNTPNTYFLFTASGSRPTSYKGYGFSTTQGAYVWTGSSDSRKGACNNYDSTTGLYYSNALFNYNSYVAPSGYPVTEQYIYTSLSACLLAVSGAIATNNADVGISLITADGSVSIPDNEDDNYLPAPLGIPLNIPWNNGFADNIDLLYDDILNDSLENALEAVDEIADPEPVEPVMPPFLPAQVPSLRFNLSGIWYYVVRWVNSISAGLGFFSNIWNNIPAAMFYPVFGSAVAVLVLGVFRRFFG